MGRRGVCASAGLLPSSDSQKMNATRLRKIRTQMLIMMDALPSAGVAASGLQSRITWKTCQCWRMPLRAKPSGP